MGTARPILVVDDDEDIRDMLSMVLQSTGYTVETAVDGVDALARLSGGLRPSMILLDMMMPRMDGEDFLAAERSIPDLAGIPVVLVSGHAAARQKAAELHTEGYLVKPIEVDDLLVKVQELAGDD